VVCNRHASRREQRLERPKLSSGVGVIMGDVVQKEIHLRELVGEDGENGLFVP
jgi:hypothetical protein